MKPDAVIKQSKRIQVKPDAVIKQSKRIPFQVKPSDHMLREQTVMYQRQMINFPCMRLLVLNADKGMSLAERERGGKEALFCIPWIKWNT